VTDHAFTTALETRHESPRIAFPPGGNVTGRRSSVWQHTDGSSNSTQDDMAVSPTQKETNDEQQMDEERNGEHDGTREQRDD
jgi:hypothetical protein